MARGTIHLNGDQAARLGPALAHRRITLGYRSARALGRVAGLDYRTITALEAGQPRDVDRNTLTTLEVVLNWPAGTIDAIIDGNHLELDEALVDDISADIVAKAREMAQATFDAYLRTHRSS